MHWLFRPTFRKKLFTLFIALSLVPLLILALLVSKTVEESYKETLKKSFETSVKNRERLINYYFEGNKAWIKSIAAQDIFLTELEKYAVQEKFAENKLFASIVSIRRENQFIDKIYITDDEGDIISSTTTDDEDKNVTDLGYTLIVQKSPYYYKIRNTKDNKRVITLAAPFIKRSNNEIIGYLVAEINASVIKALIEGNIYDSSSLNQIEENVLGLTSIIDEDGYVLTKISGLNIPKISGIYPLQNCINGHNPQTNIWTNADSKEVYGSYKCSQLDAMGFTYVVERETTLAFAVSNNIRNSIFGVTTIIGILIAIGITTLSRSVTDPIRKLTKGALEMGRGNFKYSFNIKTGDEIEELGNSFADMAQKIDSSISHLKEQDAKLNEINDELEKEKQTISAERNKLEVIIAGITDAIIALDMQQIVVSCNKAAIELLGLPENQIVGKKISESIRLINDTGELETDVYAPIRTDEFEGVIFSNDRIKLLSQSGKATIVKLITGKIKEAVSVNLGCILTFHDLSKEAQLEEMKLDFVSMAAHELRTPITSIRGYAQLLGDEISEFKDERANDWNTLITRISISAEQLLALVENLLNVTKIEKGILTIACKPEKWKELIEEVAAVFKDRAQNKNITLTIHEIDPTLVAYVDRIRINEVISNLISNAINYTQEGGRIDVETHATPDGKFIETSVADNGKGIPKTAQTHLFEKFFRVTGPLEQGSKGNGLGLYISKSIVEMHGGKIWVESDEGKGAKFIYTIQRIDNNDVSKYSY